MRRIKIEMPYPVPAQERYVPYDMMLNDIGFWYPILRRSGVFTPKTILVNGDVEPPASRIKQAMDEIGYPCFFRGGSIASSLKHRWEETCFIKESITHEEILNRCLKVLLHCSSTNSGAEPLIYDNWAIREYIVCDTVYYYRHMPLKKEMRVFIDGNSIVCMHHYWDEQIPEGVVIFSKEELDALYKEAEKVAKYFMVRDRYGTWRR